MQKGHVVILEDDATFGASLKSTFERDGYVVLLTGKIDEAKDYLGNFPVNAIFVDCLLPGISGIDFVEEIRKRFPAAVLDVVLMSGLFTDATFIKESLRQTQALSFLKKPFDVKQALNLVKPTVADSVEEEEVPPRKALYQLLSKQNVKVREKRKAIEALENVHGYDLPLLYSLLSETESSGHLNIIKSAGEVMGVSFSKGQIVGVDIADQETQLGKLLIDAGFLTPEDLQDALTVISPKRLGERLIQGNYLSPHAFEIALENQMSIRLARTICDAQLTINFVATEVDLTHPNISSDRLLVYIHDWVTSKLSADWLKTHFIQWSGSRLYLRDSLTDDHSVFNLPLLSGQQKLWKNVSEERSFDEFIEKNRNQEDMILKSAHFLLVTGLVFFDERPAPSKADRLKVLQKIEGQMKGRNKLEIYDVLLRLTSVTDGATDKVQFGIKKILGPAPTNEDPMLLQVHSNISKIVEQVLEFAKTGNREQFREEMEKAEFEQKMKATSLLDDAKNNLIKGQIANAAAALQQIDRMEVKPDRYRTYEIWLKLVQLDPKKNINIFLKEVEVDLLSIPPEDRIEASYHFVMGLFQKTRGDLNSAKRAFEKSLNLDSQFLAAKRELNLIGGLASAKKDVLNRDLKDLVSGFFKKR